MARREDIVKFLNKSLNVSRIKDASINGLQVKGSKEVFTVGFGVDACLETINKAKKASCDMLIVHHGLLWAKDKNIKIKKIRMSLLKKYKISLYACHLPLDLNIDHGNNIELCRILKLNNIKRFGNYHRLKIGFKGEFEKEKSLKEISKLIDNGLKTKSKVYQFNNKKIKTIGIVSGEGADCLIDAVEERLDCFLTGEVNLSWYKTSKDLNLNLMSAGHYSTETLGVKSLMPILSKKFSIKAVFIDAKSDI